MFAAKPAVLPYLAVGNNSSAQNVAVNSTAALTRRLAAGEEESFREFYDLYSHRLFGYLYVLCRGDAEHARELLQQTMIKVARHARVFDQEQIFWGWLMRLARSSWIDEGRKRNRYIAALERLWKGRAEDPVSPTEEMAHAWMDALDEADRLLLTKKYLEGLSLRELAEHFGVSEKAVESRLTRARNRIKEIILRGDQ
jgi:RNA polymerase sigma-70 factor, ECF subfamily